MVGAQQILSQSATEEKGDIARLASFVGALAISDLVKTTLGPKGMDKILQSVVCRAALCSAVRRAQLTHASPAVAQGSDKVTVTNDGATILQSIHVDNPAAKVLVDISKVQDAEVGDGTTSVVVLAGELLREAEKLINLNVHPMVRLALLSPARFSLPPPRNLPSCCFRSVLHVALLYRRHTIRLGPDQTIIQGFREAASCGAPLAGFLRQLPHKRVHDALTARTHVLSNGRCLATQQLAPFWRRTRWTTKVTTSISAPTF
jgi:hypothetical protein